MDDTWKSDLDRWLSPFLNTFRHKARARMCPVYVAGLIGAGDRKSVQPMAARDGEVGYDQLHHFIASGVWDAAPLENVLLAEADRMVGGADAWLIVDDTALPKKGEHSVGVAPQYASSLGKTANCQSLVSLTLASREVPVMVGLRLFLPENWTDDPERMARARGTLKSDEAGEQLRHSFAGMMGRAIEPFIAPLGFDWKMGIGIIGSFAAREVFVSTMSTVYNVGEAQDDEAGTASLAKMLGEQNRPDGTRLYTPLLGITLMVFYVFALQCVSTIAVVRRETNGWKWPVFQWLYMTALAWVLAFLTWHGGHLLGFR